jgi:hypothetical protein
MLRCDRLARLARMPGSHTLVRKRLRMCLQAARSLETALPYQEQSVIPGSENLGGAGYTPSARALPGTAVILRSPAAGGRRKILSRLRMSFPRRLRQKQRSCGRVRLRGSIQVPGPTRLTRFPAIPFRPPRPVQTCQTRRPWHPILAPHRHPGEGARPREQAPRVFVAAARAHPVTGDRPEAAAPIK